MPNAKDSAHGTNTFERLLVVGRTGSGKSSQMWTLPGRKFGYFFDPNTMPSIRGLDIDYEEYYADFLEMDATLKGFNKGSKSDKLPQGTRREPTVYMKWVEDINAKVAKGFFRDYQWLCFDSLTFITKATMDRQLYINNRYGEIEELADYRIVGSKLADIFGSIAGMPINLYCTGHIQSFQDEKTKKIEVQINAPGKSRNVLPLIFTNVWLAHVDENEKGGVAYKIRTQPEPRGLQDIRTSIPGLNMIEDVTIKEFSNETSTRYGIGAILQRRK